MSSHPPPLERLYSIVRLEREDITTLIIYGLGIGLMSLASPIALQALVNTIAFGALLQPLIVLTLILFVLMSFGNALAAWQFYVVEMLQRRLFVRLFGNAASRLQQVDFAARDSQYLPELSNRFFDIVTLQKTASVMLLDSLGYVLQTLIGMLLLAFYHPILLAFDLFVLIMLVLIVYVMGTHGVSTAMEQSKAKYTAAAWLNNMAGNAILGKSTAAQVYFRQQTDLIALDYLSACEQHFRILLRQNIGALTLHAVASTLLLGLGGWMVIDRQLSLGQLIAAELVVNTMLYGLTRLGKILDTFYELLTSIDKIGYLLDLPQEKELGASPVRTMQPYQVNMANVSLPISPQLDKIQYLNLDIAAGERVVISSGAQRGSLLELLYGLRTPASGSVSLNNLDLRDLNLGQLRDTIALVSEPETIPASIADNLHMGRALDLHALQQVLSRVGLLDFVTHLSDGMNTQLGLQGAPLSREQCLRLSLARAMAIQPRLLMLDHVLDRVDQQYLPIVMDSLLSADAPWTLLVISQQERVIKAFSRHLRIENGTIIEVKQSQEKL